MNNPFFSIEDIYLYRGEELSNHDFNYKINKIATILKNDIKQVSYDNNFIIFGLPIICKTNEDFDKSLLSISYKLDSVKYIKNNSHFTLSFDEFKSDVKDCLKEKRFIIIKELFDSNECLLKLLTDYLNIDTISANYFTED